MVLTLLAVCGLMVSGLMTASLPSATPFTPATIPSSNVPTDPSVAVQVTHTPNNPHPKQGQTVNYQMDFVLTGVSNETGVGRVLTVNVYADTNAPFNAVPALGTAARIGDTNAVVPSGATGEDVHHAQAVSEGVP